MHITLTRAGLLLRVDKFEPHNFRQFSTGQSIILVKGMREVDFEIKEDFLDDETNGRMLNVNFEHNWKGHIVTVYRSNYRLNLP